MKRQLLLLIALLVFSIILLPQNVDLIQEADMLLDMMEYKAALDYYLKALAQYPNQRDLRKKIGYAYLELKETDEALKYTKEELTLFPDNADAYDLLVYVLFKENKLGEADSFLRKHGFPFELTEKIPSLGGLAHFILGVYLKECKEYGKANEYLLSAIDKGYDPVKCYV